MLSDEFLDIITAGETSLEDQLGRLMGLGCDRLGFELGIVSRVEDGTYTVRACRTPADLPIGVGDTFPLEQTFCCQTLAADGPVGFNDSTGTEWASHPACREFGLNAYLGAPITVGGRVYGTVNFSARQARPDPVSEDELSFMRRIARWISQELMRRQSLDHHRQLGQRFRGVLASANDGVMIFRAARRSDARIEDFVWTDVNPAACRMVGMHESDLVGRRLLQVLPGNKTDGLFDRYVQVVETGQPILFEHEYRHDGISAWFRISARRMDDGFVVSFAEITDLKRSQRDATRAREQADMIIDHVPSMIWFKDRDSRIIRANAAVAKAMGRPKDEIEGRLTEELHPDGASAFVRADREAMASGRPRLGIIEPVTVGPSDTRWVSTDKIPIFDDTGVVTGLLVVATDITRLKRTEDQLRRMAEHDALTDAANRRSFTRALETHFENADESTHFGLMMLDFDRFKGVNDTLGHEAGDELLRSIADRIRACIKGSDVVARLGGDEFAVLLTHLTDPEQALGAAERIRAACEAPHSISGRELVSTASIGVVTSDLAFEDWESMMAAADGALFEAKAEGRNRVVGVDPDRLQATRRAARIETGFRSLVESDTIRFEYQPVFDTESTALRGLEVLARWPGHSVPTHEFIQVTERTDAIHLLTPRAIDAALRAAALPEASGLFVAFNLTGREMLHHETPRLLADAIEQSGVDPSTLVVDVSESTVCDGRSDVRGALERLRETGVRIAVEHFGAGTASVRQIRELPIDMLKLDRQLVAEGAQDSRVTAVIDALTSLAANLGILVGADGIETTEQLAMLQSMQIELFQGHLRAPSMMIEDLEEFLRQQPGADARPRAA